MVDGLLVLLGVLLAACSDEQADAPGNSLDAAVDGTEADATADSASEACPTVTPTIADVVAAGDRRMGVALTLPGDPQSEQGDTIAWAAAEARALGAGIVEINIDWANIEIADGVYVDHEGQLATANAALAGSDTEIHLNIAPYQTTYDARPAHLASLDWDDPLLPTAYRDVLSFTLDQLPALEGQVTHVMVGNEVEMESPAQWQAYADFLVSAYSEVKQMYSTRNPGREVTTSVKLALGYATSSDVAPWSAALWALGDWVNVTFYPLRDDFEVDLPAVAEPRLEGFFDWVDAQSALGPTKPVLLSEVGYPTADALQIADGHDGRCHQALFVQSLFSFWDDQAQRIPGVTFVWLSDLTEAQAEALLIGYGLTEAVLGPQMYFNLRAFFASLGLLDQRGVRKAGADQLLAESCARGFAECL